MEHEEISEQGVVAGVTSSQSQQAAQTSIGKGHTPGGEPWRVLSRWWYNLPIVPRWFGGRWRSPTVGYLLALLLQVITALVMYLMIRIFPTFAFPGVLTILATLIVALIWGEGPSLFAAVIGALLVNYIVLAPQFSWSLDTPQHVIETGLLLVIGLTISLIASKTEYLRAEAEDARQGLAELVKQLKIEKETLYQSEQRVRVSLEALLMMAEELVQLPEAVRQEGEQVEATSTTAALTQRLAEMIRSVLACQRVSITTLDPETQALRSAAVVGISPAQEKLWRERRPGYSLSEQLHDPSIDVRLRTNEVFVIDMTRPPYHNRPNPYGIHSMILAPMTIGKRLIGVLALDHGGKARVYTENDLALAKAAAELAALVIERDRLLTERAEARANELALRESNNLMDEFIGIAGHEIRTPLTSIKGSVQLAKRQLHRVMQQEEAFSANVTTTINKIQDLLDRAERQIALQNRLVSDLLDVARIRNNRLELHPELCDILALLRETAEDQRFLAPTRTIRLKNSFQGEILVMADADRLRQVINNYLSNALKYSETSKPVEVSVEQEETCVRVSVRDEGPGLTRTEQQRIWERFYRVEGVEVKSGSGVGLGLGLHICKMIIERQGGSVGVQSTPGKGSVFWFTLPLIESGNAEAS